MCLDAFQVYSYLEKFESFKGSWFFFVLMTCTCSVSQKEFYFFVSVSCFMKWLLHDFACPFFFFWFYVRTGFFFILMTCTWCFIENTFFPCTRFMERNPFNECSIKQIPINLVPQDSRDRVASGALSIFFLRSKCQQYDVSRW